jgi:hypothetical protein
MFATVPFALTTLAQKRVLLRDPRIAEDMGNRRLCTLLRHAATYSRFYQKRYRGLNPDSLSLSDLRPVTKVELMSEFDDVVTDNRVSRETAQDFLSEPENLGKYFAGRYVISHTSGTQGRPMIIVQDRKQLDLLFALQFSRGNVGFTGSVGEAVRRLIRPFRLAVITMRPGLSVGCGLYLHAAVGSKIRRAPSYWL